MSAVAVTGCVESFIWFVVIAPLLVLLRSDLTLFLLPPASSLLGVFDPFLLVCSLPGAMDPSDSPSSFVSSLEARAFKFCVERDEFFYNLFLPSLTDASRDFSDELTLSLSS